MKKFEALALNFQIGDSLILNDLSVTANSGERLGIIGPNGSGKTTFFNCLSGFSRPQKGEIVFDGQNVTKLSPSERANKGLGRLFQNFGIFRDLSVYENLLIAIESREKVSLFSFLKSKDFTEEIMSLLSLVHLQDKKNHKAGSLSGGQLRLLEIIRLIAFDAKLYLLDEPTAGVSPKMKLDILDALNRLLPKDAIVMLIEHDINFIKDFCTRALVFDSGHCVLSGTVEEVRENPVLQEVYFGVSTK